MLKQNLLHPEILQSLAGSGHGAKILIADGNFPVSTSANERCKKVYLNLSPDMLKVTDVLQVIKEQIAIESAFIMEPPDGSKPAIHEEFERILGGQLKWELRKRIEFYREVSFPDTALVIATGDTRRFANIILVMGTVFP
jgi:L-fucose mutarotase